jgi:tripartite-type tricarboxylate transporter receptor subunit TctC
MAALETSNEESKPQSKRILSMVNGYGLSIVAAALIAISTLAAGQDPRERSAAAFPNKPMRIVVPFVPGGSTDILARLVAQKLTEAFGRQVIVENRPSAGGIVGVQTVATATPDGHTLIMGHIGTFTINPTLFQKLPYDAVKDFQPITLVAMVPNMLTVNPKLPVRSVEELVSLARSKPGALNYASGGNGSAAHLAMEYFKLLAKVDFAHIPYKGTGPAVIDVMGGHVSLILTGVPPQLAHVKAGRLRPLGVSTTKRLAILPEIPTIAEAGVRGYEAVQWYGVLAPARTPKDIVAKLNATIVKAIMSKEVREQLAAEAAEPVGNSPPEFHAYIKAEIARWAPVIKASGARPD